MRGPFGTIIVSPSSHPFALKRSFQTLARIFHSFPPSAFQRTGFFGLFLLTVLLNTSKSMGTQPRRPVATSANQGVLNWGLDHGLSCAYSKSQIYQQESVVSTPFSLKGKKQCFWRQICRKMRAESSEEMSLRALNTLLRCASSRRTRFIIVGLIRLIRGIANARSKMDPFPNPA